MLFFVLIPKMFFSLLMQCSTPLARQSPDAMNLIKTVMSHSITVVMVSDEIQGHLKMNSSMFIWTQSWPPHLVSRHHSSVASFLQSLSESAIGKYE